MVDVLVFFAAALVTKLTFTLVTLLLNCTLRILHEVKHPREYFPGAQWYFCPGKLPQCHPPYKRTGVMGYTGDFGFVDEKVPRVDLSLSGET